MLGALLVSCAPRPTAPAPVYPPTEIPTTTPAPATATPLPGVRALWISPAVPDPLRVKAEPWGIPLTQDARRASAALDVRAEAEDGGSNWIYALVAPFPTVLDGVTFDQLRAFWKGTSSEAFAKWPLLMTDSTLKAFSA